MATHKPTTDPKQLWTFLGLLGLVVGIFGYAVLPFLDPARAPSTGSVAPDFTLGLLGEEGETGRVQLSDYRGYPVVLDFWASWCAPCRAQAPILDRVSKQMESAGVRMIGVNTGDQPEAARAFVQSAALSYPSVVDSTGEVARAFGAHQLPTLVLIDGKGNIVSVQSRIVSEEELLAELQQLLNAS